MQPSKPDQATAQGPVKCDKCQRGLADGVGGFVLAPKGVICLDCYLVPDVLTN